MTAYLLPLALFLVASCRSPAGASANGQQPVAAYDIDAKLSPVNRSQRVNSDSTSSARIGVNSAETERAFALERSADFVAHYTMEETFYIGVGKAALPGARTTDSPQQSSAAELIGFFDNQLRKDLIVVIFDKSPRSDEEIRAEVTKLNLYFKDRGYKRVVLQQARGYGRETYSDT